ncbi:MAG: Ig-like domain-containing protein [Bryobacteraceae bacterium]
MTLEQPTDKLDALPSPRGGTFVWTSSDSNVVGVSGSGDQCEIQRLDQGTATITVTYTVGSCTPCTGAATVTAPKRNFIIVIGEQGLKRHNLGKLLELAANTHEREVRSNALLSLPVPRFLPGDKTTTAPIHLVADLVAQLSVNDIIYLAYFGHGWGDDASTALNIGQDHVKDSNLTIAQDPLGIQTCTPPSVLPKPAFRPNAIARLYSCRAAFGTNPIAKQMADHLGIHVYGYPSGEGSMFTNDPTLGHGARAATQKDQSASVSAAKDVWMVPFTGVPAFSQF